MVRLPALAVVLGVFASGAAAESTAEVWVTTQDLSKRLAREPAAAFSTRPAPAGLPQSGAPPGVDLIEVQPEHTYQMMLGLGASLEHSTCYNLSRLSQQHRDEAIKRLVDPRDGIGMNLMRICIGTPDFTGEPWYSYNDLPPGQTDAEVKRFSIDKDRAYVLPVLKQALAANPNLLYFASPWSPPGWMKSTGSMIGGRLLTEHYPAYAQYFVKFVQAYEREGIPIYAVTVQNEPGVDRQHDEPKWRYPSCRWTAEQERDFIRDHLGPALQRNGLATRIWCYDHNYNVAPTPDGDDPGIAYPRTILSDAAAARYVSGVAFHGYAGKPDGMSQFLQEFPDRPAHFTEGSVFGLAGAQRLISLLANGASSYNAWVTMIDTDGGPNNGPFRASRTCIMLDSRELAVDYRIDYYLYGQFMKFIDRGALRIKTSVAGENLAAIAFKNPDGTLVLIVVNPVDRERSVTIGCREQAARAPIAARSTTTLRWRASGE